MIAENSSSVELTAHLGSVGYDSMDQASLSRALERDLQVQTWRTIAASLVAAGPRMTEQEIGEALAVPE